MTKNESAIEQINLGFNDQEDRLLLKLGLVDKTEVTVWITRRICKAMWSLLQGVNGNLSSVTTTQSPTPAIATPGNKNQAIENFALEVAEQKKLDNMDFQSEYIAGRDTLTEVPMLAVQCVIVTNENTPPHLEFQCTNGQAVKIVLNNELIYAVTNMMLLATREAGWDLLMTSNNMKAGLNPTHQVLH